MPTCTVCNSESPAGNKFCGECGAALGDRCPHCGADNPAGKKFCGDCGTALVAAGDKPQTGSAPGSPEASGAEVTPAGERRQLTVLFCDLVGSTALSQQLDPEDWRDVIAQYQQAARAAVERWGGYVAKELGDGLLVYFGWPDAREDDPERAIRAGLAIIEGVKGLGDRTPILTPNPLTPNPLSVRVGMHTGPVVIADGGEVFGETANVAARVQGLAEPDTVMTTAATQRLVSGIFVVENRGPQVLKGVREPVTLHRVVQPSGVRSRLGVAAGRLTRFVGREVELAALVDRWERAQDGEGQNVVVLGEAGVGKSRLVYQLHEHLKAVPHTWLECGSTPYTEGTPFHPVIALVSQGLAFAPEDTAADKLAKLEAGLRALASVENVALIADFLGLPSPTRLQFSPELQRRKTIELLAQWNLALSEVQPLVLVVEDLHGCDVSTLEFLGHLIAQTPTARVLLLATARPEFTPPWPARSNLTTLQLARLTRRQARDLVVALVAGFGVQGAGVSPNPEPRALDPAVIDGLVARADGVPLYVEELTKAVAEPWAARGADAIPSTLAGSLMARLDRLSTAKDVAQRAAVLGREFGYPLLAAVAGMEDAGLRQGLTRLVGAEIVFQRGEPPDATYTFKHALVQEAAYASLLKRTRQHLHARVVEVLRERFRDRVELEPEVVARHAEAAGQIDDAITYYGRAGEQAQARAAHAEAIGHLRHAIALLATRPEGGERDTREAAFQLLLGGSLVPARGFSHPECAAAYERARVLCETAGDARQLGLALSGLANSCSTRGEVERGRAFAARVLTAAEQSGDRELALIGHVQVAVAEFHQGKFASALVHGEAARSLYEAGRYHALVSTLGLADAVSFSAGSLWALGWPDRALARVREAVELAHDLQDPFNLATTLFNETAVHWLRRDSTAQRERAREVIALSEANSFPEFLGVGRAFHAAARVAAGETGAVADLLAGLALLAESGNQSGAPAVFALLGQAYMTAGQLAEARSAVETGLALAAQTGQPFFDADLYRLQGEILRMIADSQQSRVESEKTVEESFHRALDIARGQEAKSVELRAATSLARVWRDRGARAAARDLLAPVYGWFTEGFDTSDLVEAKALLEDLR